MVKALEAVAGLEDAGGVADPVLRLADGTACTLGRQDPRFAIWQRVIESARKSGMPVFVACAPAGGAVRAILPSAARCIERVGPEADGDRLPVRIEMSPSAHFLSSTRPGHPQMRALLEEAARTDEALLLAVDPATLEILAARRPPQGLKIVVI
jgi:hypothetical protein